MTWKIARKGGNTNIVYRDSQKIRGVKKEKERSVKKTNREEKEDPSELTKINITDRDGKR